MHACSSDTEMHKIINNVTLVTCSNSFYDIIISSQKWSEAFVASVAAIVKNTIPSGSGNTPPPLRILPWHPHAGLVRELLFCNILLEFCSETLYPSPPRPQQTLSNPVKVQCTHARRVLMIHPLTRIGSLPHSILGMR